ncbi:ABC transporter ATP-binding protein [Pectinatus brassicae]|uniref:Teichoic acid transport system ATP-binding protein n=1 Tax=Pectinatus brassicae TaxID=862415 RepID=A0A840UQA5_9FIRM|nr:ABC transporter ATP-binding protein [Pectinatus brassicae]MBB5336888.1 teichoic acid transport system ATP-binding protein [Pectinatus brassicae]
MSTEIAIKVEHLSKVYKIFDKPIDRVKESLNPFHKRYSRDFYALNDVSFEIKKGETIGIIGKNGAGKSTLLKILTGVLTPSAGTIQVNGRVASLLELGAGFNPEMTGIENIYLNGTVMGYSKEEMDGKLNDIIEFADIGDFINQPVKMYSSGMFARLAFAVNAFVDPDILIVDEALSVGDLEFQNKCYRKFNDLKNENKTIIFVTHDINSILKYCNRSFLLKQGNLVGSGTSKTVVDLYKKMISGGSTAKNDIKEKITDNKNKYNNWKGLLNLNKNFLEYGNKKIEIIDFALENEKNEITSIVSSDEYTKIKIRIKMNEKIDSPIFAYSIKDIKGTELIGSNTFVEGVNTDGLQKNDFYEIVFKQKLSLCGGDYTLSFGCTKHNGDELTIYHRLYDMVLVKIMSVKPVCGLFNVNTEINLDKI